MAEEEFTYLVVNWINMEEGTLLVGATDNLRWGWEKEVGSSGADAASIVYVTLKDEGPGRATVEMAGFHAAPGDPVRKLAMSFLPELFEVAWAIKNESLTYQEAKKRFFGMEIGSK